LTLNKKGRGKRRRRLKKGGAVGGLAAWQSFFVCIHHGPWVLTPRAHRERKRASEREIERETETEKERAREREREREREGGRIVWEL